MANNGFENNWEDVQCLSVSILKFLLCFCFHVNFIFFLKFISLLLHGEIQQQVSFQRTIFVLLEKSTWFPFSLQRSCSMLYASRTWI